MGDLGLSLRFTHIIKRTDVPTDEAAAHPEQSVLSLSHYPDNTSAGALVGMCRSSVGSLGTAREQFVPSRHQSRPHREHHLLYSSRWGGSVGCRRVTGVCDDRRQKHNVPFRPCWLASRCKSKAQLKYWCLVVQLIKRRSPNYPVGKASLAVPGERYELPILDLL